MLQAQRFLLRLRLQHSTVAVFPPARQPELARHLRVLEILRVRLAPARFPGGNDRARHHRHLLALLPLCVQLMFGLS